MEKNIIIVGVGGQGTLLASRILGAAATIKGYDVKVSEVHGMAQRGGSVVTYVKYGEKVHSPIVAQGTADIILAFEMLEGFRYLPYLKKDGVLIVNSQTIDPMPVITGAMEYPADIIEKIKAKNIKVISVNALEKALEAGSSKAVNVALIGTLANSSPIEKEVFIKALEQTVPEKFLELNKKAFELGYNSWYSSTESDIK